MFFYVFVNFIILFPRLYSGGHARMVIDTSSSNKLDYGILVKEIINPEGYQNCMICSKVTAIQLKGLIWPIGGVALERVFTQPAEQSYVSRKNGCSLPLE